MSEESKSKSVQIRLTPEQYDIVLAEAKKQGVNLSNYIKMQIFGDTEFADYYDKIKKNADRLSSGTKFTIKALMDTKWEISRGMRLSLSKAFRRGVSCGDVRDVIELEQDSSKIIWYMKR